MKIDKGKFEIQITYKGKTQSIKAWSRETGIKYNTLYKRIFYRRLCAEDCFELIPEGEK